MTGHYLVNIGEYYIEAYRVACVIRDCHRGRKEIKAYGIPRGGITAAFAVKAAYDASLLLTIVDYVEDADIIIDDIYDSGATYERFKKKYPEKPFYALFDKRTVSYKGKWLIMPYERTLSGQDESSTDIITRLLEFIGEDPTREGLRETPSRMLKAWKERTSGYAIDPRTFLKTFEDGAQEANDAWVIVNGIPVVSVCEHHGADIIGTASVGYIPKDRIIGLSKLARITDAYCRRLQCQERITNQIATLLDKELQPTAVGVLIKATHACMSTRGTKIHGAVTVTSALRGAALRDPACRAEFLQLCQSDVK